MLSHIVAASENNVIGSKNQLPWRLASDFAYFKNKTWGLPVIMGRKTYDSLNTELAGRMNIVVTSKEDFAIALTFLFLKGITEEPAPKSSTAIVASFFKSFRRKCSILL